MKYVHLQFKMKNKRNRVVKKCMSYFPILEWLPQYNGEKAISDLMAGLTVGLTIIPQSIAFAFIADLPPQVSQLNLVKSNRARHVVFQYGLYSSFMSTFAYIFLGTVKEISVGPTTLMALMSLEFTTKNPGYAPLMSLVNGTVLLTIGLLHLGFLVNFVSLPVISGKSRHLLTRINVN